MNAPCFFDLTRSSRSPLGTDHDVGLPTLVSKFRPALRSAPSQPTVLFSQSDHSKPKTVPSQLSPRSMFHAFSGQALIQSP